MTENAPNQKIAMRQRWSDLFFAHWPLPPDEIQRLLPEDLKVDTFDGMAYVSVVAFTMTNVALSWFTPMPGVSGTLECNVRTYVRRKDGTDPGIWFFSLDASNAAMVAVARATYSLPYFYAKMNTMQVRKQTGGTWNKAVSYDVTRTHPGAAPAACALEYEPASGHVELARFGTLEEFLVERYRLYTVRNRTLYRANVHHSPYKLEPVKLISMTETLTDAAGIAVPNEPPLVHFAREVFVEVEPVMSDKRATTSEGNVAKHCPAPQPA